MISVEEGRKEYNAARASRPGLTLEIRQMNNHEAAVAAFFAQCEAEKPDETASVFAKYPVLTERQLDDRRKRELHAFAPGSELGGDGEPGESDGDYDGVASPFGLDNRRGLDMNTSASMRVANALIERQEEARRRGEPVPDVISSWTW